MPPKIWLYALVSMEQVPSNLKINKCALLIFTLVWYQRKLIHSHEEQLKINTASIVPMKNLWNGISYSAFELHSNIVSLSVMVRADSWESSTSFILRDSLGQERRKRKASWQAWRDINLLLWKFFFFIRFSDKKNLAFKNLNCDPHVDMAPT